MNLVTELKAALSYSSETGEFTIITKRKGTRGVGKTAGTKMKNGYISICFNRKKLLAHRIAWAFIHGEFPDLEIDHDDGDRSNNRIDNLNVVTRKKNHRNMKQKIAGKIPGLRFRKNSWNVQLRDGERQRHIGCFKLREDAIAALRKARVEFGYSERHAAISK